MNSWINGSLNDKNLNLITRILSDSSILKNIDREKFAKEWIN
nr:MAG TPA: hypothetical protein [Bacteriophage sp.]